MGSADWMNRNIYRRIEVCFPIYHEDLKKQLIDILALQWDDTVQAVWIDEKLHNAPVTTLPGGVRSQEAIYQYLTRAVENLKKTF